MASKAEKSAWDTKKRLAVSQTFAIPSEIKPHFRNSIYLISKNNLYTNHNFNILINLYQMDEIFCLHFFVIQKHFTTFILHPSTFFHMPLVTVLERWVIVTLFTFEDIFRKMRIIMFLEVSWCREKDFMAIIAFSVLLLLIILSFPVTSVIGWGFGWVDLKFRKLRMHMWNRSFIFWKKYFQKFKIFKYHLPTGTIIWRIYGEEGGGGFTGSVDLLPKSENESINLIVSLIFLPKIWFITKIVVFFQQKRSFFLSY